MASGPIIVAAIRMTVLNRETASASASIITTTIAIAILIVVATITATAAASAHRCLGLCGHRRVRIEGGGRRLHSAPPHRGENVSHLIPASVGPNARCESIIGCKNGSDTLFVCFLHVIINEDSDMCGHFVLLMIGLTSSMTPMHAYLRRWWPHTSRMERKQSSSGVMWCTVSMARRTPKTRRRPRSTEIEPSAFRIDAVGDEDDDDDDDDDDNGPNDEDEDEESAEDADGEGNADDDEDDDEDEDDTEPGGSCNVSGGR